MKYDQTTARQDVLGIARTRESPGQGNRQETRTARKEESPGKAKRQDRRIDRKSEARQGKREAPRKREEKTLDLRLIDGASDSVGNHVGVSE